MATCNKIETGSCGDCNVPAMLWGKIHEGNRRDIDEIADKISSQYCPEKSGGIDGETKAIIYNHNSVAKVSRAIWEW